MPIMGPRIVSRLHVDSWSTLHVRLEVNYENPDDAKKCVNELHGMDSWLIPLKWRPMEGTPSISRRSTVLVPIGFIRDHGADWFDLIRNYIIIVFAWQLFRADISQVYLLSHIKEQSSRCKFHCNSVWCTDVTTLADAKANKFVYVFSGEIILPVVLLWILEKTSIDQPPKCKDLREDKEAEEELGPDGHPVPWHYVTMHGVTFSQLLFLIWGCSCRSLKLFKHRWATSMSSERRRRRSVRRSLSLLTWLLTLQDPSRGCEPNIQHQ